MTGYGEAHRQEGALTVAVEVRTINSRYFKLSVRCGEGYSALEQDIEGVVRQHIRRGTVQVSLRVDGPQSDSFRLNGGVLAGYRKQIDALRAQWLTKGGTAAPGAKTEGPEMESVPLSSLLMLPGVVVEKPASAAEVATEWPLVRSTLEAALAHLHQMRVEEGQAMATDLSANYATVDAELTQIEGRAGLVVDGYRARLVERLNKVLAEFQVTLDPADLIKEVSIYAERSDISEEIVRLRSHLVQFDDLMRQEESSGRKLEFLTQEMFRETNTIGSKASDVQIARHVIEIKAAIERIREMIQNVE
jgi:uncharacterized protein (TIGR00255 family)